MRLLQIQTDRFGIDRFGIEKSMLLGKGKQRILAVPENRDASILEGIHVEQSRTNFRSFLSTSIDRGIEIDRIDVEKSRMQNTEKSTARRRKIVRAPKIPMRRFPYAKHTQTLKKFRSFLRTSIDRRIEIIEEQAQSQSGQAVGFSIATSPGPVAAFRTSSFNLPSSALTWNRLPGVDGVWIAENGAVDSSSGQLRRVPKGAGKSVRGPRDLKRDY